MSIVAILLLLSGCAQSTPEPDIPLTGPETGRKLYLAKCSKCHKLYDPAKYSDSEWSKWMAKMTRKARLTREQSSFLTTYIDENLRHTGASEGNKNN